MIHGEENYKIGLDIGILNCDVMYLKKWLKVQIPNGVGYELFLT
jgi:hypothetical protein